MQPSPDCWTCMDLKNWGVSDISRGIDVLHDGSYTIHRRLRDFRLSAARCEKCAIILEGLTLFADLKRISNDLKSILVEGGIYKGITAYASTPGYYTGLIEFYTIQGKYMTHFYARMVNVEY